MMMKLRKLQGLLKFKSLIGEALLPQNRCLVSQLPSAASAHQFHTVTFSLTFCTAMELKKKPRFIEIDGFILDETFSAEKFRSATKYKPRPNDVVVATYPKSGTTWMCQIVLLVLRKGKSFVDTEEYFRSCPFIEFEGAESAENMLKPGCIKTHLPYDRLTFSDEAKYIYVARHPRDCAVSAFHQTKYFPTYFFSDGSFDDFFELFVRGEVDCNDYFDNLLSWYHQRNKPNIFFTTYENMKADHMGTVLKVANFLGEEYYSAITENCSELLEKIVRESSFEYMKKVTNKMFKDYYMNPLGGEDRESKQSYQCLRKANEEGHKSSGDFIRNGKVGEGKQVLSEEQEKRLQARILEKTKGTDVMSLWNE